MQWRLFLLRVSVVRDKSQRSKITDWTFWLQIDNAFLLKEVPAWETPKSKIQNYWLHRQRERQMSLALVSRDELCLFERDFIFQGKLQTNLHSLQTWRVSSPRLSLAWLACPKFLKWTALKRSVVPKGDQGDARLHFSNELLLKDPWFPRSQGHQRGLWGSWWNCRVSSAAHSLAWWITNHFQLQFT